MKLPFGRKKNQPGEAAKSSAAPNVNLAATLEDSESRQPFWFIEHNAATNPDGIALAGAQRTLTNAQYLTESKKLARVLRERGVKPGDIVAAALTADDNFVLMGALFHEGAVGCTAPSFENLPEWIDWVVSGTKDAPVRLGRHIRWDESLVQAISEAQPDLGPNPYGSADSPARIMFSSGTTGLPKGITYTVRILQRRAKLAKTNWIPDEPFMSLIGLGGASGTLTAFYNLMTGSPYFCSQPAQLPNARLLEKYEVKVVKASPMQLDHLLRDCRESGIKLPHLRIIESAGMMMPAQLAKELVDYFPVELRNVFGCTEAGTITVRKGDFSDPSNMGTVLSSAEVQVVDAEHNPLPAGAEGAIRWKTADQVTAYFKLPSATMESFRDGWFYSGDEGFLSPDGQLHLTGRTSELLNLGGRKLNPSYLDGLVKSVPGVADAACFAFSDGTAMPQLGIAIVKNGPIDRSAVEQLFLREFQALRPAAVIMVPEIPRAGMGKVQRRELAKQVEAKLKK